MKYSVVVAGVITVAVGGWILSGQIANGARQDAEPATETQAAPAPERPLASVRVATLTATPRQNVIIINGRTEASRTVEMRAETDGRVDEIYVNKGDRVAEGQVLGRLSMDDRAAYLAEAEAVLRQREIEHRAAEQLSKKGFRSSTELAAATAQLDAARAVVERMRIDIEHTEVRAPFDGIINSGHVEIGDYLQRGDIAATIVDLDPVVVVGHATEREVGHLEVGALGQAEIVGGQRVEGIIRYVAHAADNQTRTYRFELEVPNPNNAIRDGLTSIIALTTASGRAHFVSPSVLTLADDGTVGVKVVNDERVVEFAPVQILGDTPQGVWLGGLPETITLITVGQDFVVPGQHVEPVEAKGPIRAGDVS